jgi:uncharacterized protein (DUF952 family)
MRTTLHVVATADWEAATDPYHPASLASEGFIHCTDDRARLAEAANRHYRGDPRPYLILTVDLDATGSPWRFDDANAWYPHIYGPMACGAVIAAASFPRGEDGTFLGP